MLLSSGDSFPHLIQKCRSQLGFVTYLLNYPRIMQLTTELHVSTLQGHHQAYKITVLTKAHAVILPTGFRGLQFQCTLTLRRRNYFFLILAHSVYKM